MQSKNFISVHLQSIHHASDVGGEGVTLELVALVTRFLIRAHYKKEEGSIKGYIFPLGFGFFFEERKNMFT